MPPGLHAVMPLSPPCRHFFFVVAFSPVDTLAFRLSFDIGFDLSIMLLRLRGDNIDVCQRR